MAKLNTFKNGSGSTGTKKTKNTTISYQKRAKTKSFDQFNFSEGQRKALKILGLFLLLLAGLFTVAFVSYLFTWQSDQSYIAQSNGGWSTLMQTTDEIHDETIETPIVQNKLGKFGALLANQFMYEWFGVASFLFILVLFVIGYKFLYKRSILPVWKTVIYSLVAIILLSITLGFAQDFISNTPHILEGKFGFWTNQILKNQIGTVGTGGLLVFIFLTALVLLYNYDLRFSFQSSKKQLEDEDEEFEEDDQNYSTVNNKIKTNTQQNIATDTYAVPDEEEDEIGSVEFTSNKEEETPVSLPLNVNAIKPNTNFVENQQKEIELSIEPPPAPAKKTEEAAEPALTVERVIEEKPISANDLVEKFGEYDPKLDLSGYQYPGLDLLKDYGSGKITINQQELEANKNRIVETLRNYSIEIEHIKATIGPTVTLYEIIPKPGGRISKIKNLEDDIALSLAALGIRIIAPMPGKGTIGIEVP